MNTKKTVFSSAVVLYFIFSVNAIRTPIFMADIDIHNLNVLDFKDLSRETGWGSVPTSVF